MEKRTEEMTREKLHGFDDAVMGVEGKTVDEILANAPEEDDEAKMLDPEMNVHVTPGMLGVGVAMLESGKGARIMCILPSSPFRGVAGEGDTIVGVNGVPVTSLDVCKAGAARARTIQLVKMQT